MERKECFGSIKTVILPDGFTQIQTKTECRNCQEFRDCLRFVKQPPGEKEEKEDKDELRKQEMITQVIDLSQVFSNEIGSCLLELLNRIYNSNLGTVLFKNLLLFYEVPKDSLSLSLSIPISSITLDLICKGKAEAAQLAQSVKQTGAYRQGPHQEGFSLYIVLIQKSFPKNRKANMGLIAYEIARLFSSDRQVIQQFLQTLTDSENLQFKKMDIESRMNWLMERWGFSEELEALKKEIALQGVKRRS